MGANGEYEVVVVGAGPTGLHLAGELALAGVRCKIVERRSERSKESRALVLQARTMEELDMRGMATAVLDRGHPVRQLEVSPGGHLIDLTVPDSAYPGVRALPQWETEEILEERADELGVRVERGVELTDCRQDGDRVVLSLRSGDREWRERAAWLVGCDGARSTVRHAIGDRFEGDVLPHGILIADVRLDSPPSVPALVRMVPGALAVVIGFGGGRHRIAVIDRDRPHSDGPVPVEEVDEALRTVFGLDLGPYDATWTSHFRINERRARTNRSGRVLLAGDAAHVHSPVGAQGLNLGVQDATNLGWKLAAVVAGRAGEELLDTYAEERRRVCLEVILATALATRVATARRLPVRAARQLGLRGVARFPGIRRRALARVNGTSHRYRSTAGRRRRGPAGAMVGRRVPDLGLSDGRRLYEVLRSGGFVLVDQGAGSRPPVPDAWDDLVTHLPGRVRGPRGPWLGTELFLVRPDGYCAWAGPRSRAAGDLAVVLPCWAGRRNVPRERAGAWPAG